MSENDVLICRIDEILDRREQLGMDFGLDRIKALTKMLGRPQDGAQTVHIVGTNGKSSTAAMVASVLISRGLKVGTYTSPHLNSVRERITIDGEWITQQQLLSSLEAVEKAVAKLEREMPNLGSVTQYELLTAAAFFVFDQARVDIAVVEAGLGGRLDATNVLRSSVQALTNVDLDHTEVLGTTIEQIATEKLAVVPDGGKVIVGKVSEGVQKTIDSVASQRQITARFVNSASEADVATGTSSFQRKNARLAGAVIEALTGVGLTLEEQLSIEEFELSGRFETVACQPTTIADGAHNPAGMRALVESVSAADHGRPRVLVLSVFSDKDVAGIFQELDGSFDHIICTSNSNARALSATELLEIANDSMVDAEACENPLEAVKNGRLMAGDNGVVVVAGSFGLVGDLRRQLS